MEMSTLMTVVKAGVQFLVEQLDKQESEAVKAAINDGIRTLWDLIEGKTSPEVTANMFLQLEADLIAAEKKADAEADKALADKFDEGDGG